MTLVTGAHASAGTGREAALDANRPISRRSLLGAAALLASGCAGRGEGADRLSWWAMSTKGENAPRLLPPFERETGIRVNVQALPWTAAHEKVLTAFAGGSLPDLLMVRNDWVPELTLVGAVQPCPEALIGEQFPGALAQMRVGGRSWGLPWLVDSWLQFYRRDRLAAAGYAAPPADWAGWMAMARTIKRREPDRYVVLAMLDWPEQLLAMAAQQQAPMLRDRDARGNFSSPGFRDALARYKSLFDLGYAPPILGAEAGDTIAAFARGWYAILPSAADIIDDFQKQPALFPPAVWGAAPLPGPHGPARSLADGTSLVVPRSTRRSAEAWRLAAFLCRPATELALHRITGDLPARPSAWQAPELADNAVATAFSRQIADSVAPPLVPEWARITSEVQLVAEQMVRGRFGVDAAAAEMDRRVDAILAKRRWLLDRGRIA